MTDTQTYHDKMGYCIELSRMLHAQDKDSERFDAIMMELYNLCGDDKYLSEWIDKDPLFVRFSLEFMKLHKFHNVPVRGAINVIYNIHKELDKEILEDNDKYALETKRALFGPEPEERPKDEPEKPKGILRFFRRK